MKDTEPVEEPRETPSGAFLAALFAMMAAGFVFVLDYFITVPSALFVLALAVAVFGFGVVLFLGVRQARRSGAGVFRSVGQGVWAAIRLVFDLF